jgi:hypothetical protein
MISWWLSPAARLLVEVHDLAIMDGRILAAMGDKQLP